jgi:hypothetical protein
LLYIKGVFILYGKLFRKQENKKNKDCISVGSNADISELFRFGLLLTPSSCFFKLSKFHMFLFAVPWLACIYFFCSVHIFILTQKLFNVGFGRSTFGSSLAVFQKALDDLSSQHAAASASSAAAAALS